MSWTISTADLPLRRRGAAWALLLLTLAGGTLLRVQWTGAVAPWFDSRFLLHAHSHVALLGWTFVAIFTLVVARMGRAGTADGPERADGPADRTADGPRRATGPKRAARWVIAGEALLMALILALFVAFLLHGYAFWSILLSTLHVGVTLALVGWYAFRRGGGIVDAAAPWIDLSMVWLVLANLGPLLLGAGAFMGSAWTEAWVGYYLTVTFNGWLTFAAIGLLVERGLVEVGPPLRRALAIGVLPTAVPALSAWFAIPAAAWIGWAGALLFGGGAAWVGARMLRRVGAGRRVGGAERLLAVSVAAALTLAGVLIMVGGVPSIAPRVAETRLLVVGFVHLQLLGFVSSALVLLLFRPGRPALVFFLGGVWAMVLILIGAGGLELAGRDVFGPLQAALAGTGIATLVGALLLPLSPVPKAV